MTDLASRPYGFYSVSGNHAGKVGVQLADIPELWVVVGKAAELPVTTDPAAEVAPKKKRYQSHGLAPGDPRHGTLNGYGNHGCRCVDCKAANADSQRQRRDARRGRPVPDHVHGTDTGYRNYYCKCDACKAAHKAEYLRTYRPSPRRAESRAKTEAMYADYSAGMSIEQVAEKWSTTAGAVYSRFHSAGLKRRTNSRPAAMYVDYCTGLSIAEVAAKWGVCENTVWQSFRRLNVPLRSQRGCANRTHAPKAPFKLANGVRAAEAGRRNAEAAKAALGRVVDPRPRQVLELRAANPTMSMSELAALCDPPMSKDAFAGLLRRALTGARS